MTKPTRSTIEDSASDPVDVVLDRCAALAKGWEGLAAQQRELAPGSDSGPALLRAARDMRALVASARKDLAEVTPEQYAHQHRTTTQTVTAWCRTGQIPGARRLAGGEWRLPRDAVRDRGGRR